MGIPSRVQVRSGQWLEEAAGPGVGGAVLGRDAQGGDVSLPGSAPFLRFPLLVLAQIPDDPRPVPPCPDDLGPGFSRSGPSVASEKAGAELDCSVPRALKAPVI